MRVRHAPAPSSITRRNVGRGPERWLQKWWLRKGDRLRRRGRAEKGDRRKEVLRTPRLGNGSSGICGRIVTAFGIFYCYRVTARATNEMAGILSPLNPLSAQRLLRMTYKCSFLRDRRAGSPLRFAR